MIGRPPAPAHALIRRSLLWRLPTASAGENTQLFNVQNVQNVQKSERLASFEHFEHFERAKENQFERGAQPRTAVPVPARACAAA